MQRSGLAAFTALACLLGLGSPTLGRAPRPLDLAQVTPRPPAGPPAPRPTAAPPAAPGSPEVRRPGYRACFRAAKRRGLRGSQRRYFITRCRLGREQLGR